MRQEINNVIDQVHEEKYSLYHGDNIEVMRQFPDHCIDYVMTSYPFLTLYTYSNSPRDIGNARSDEEFYSHIDFQIKELARIMKPGRNVSFHCMLVPTTKVKDGYIGLKNFRDDLIKAFEKHGFIHHSEATWIDDRYVIHESPREVVIWKDPITAMQRTKALGLLHKTVRNNSAMARQGIPDYLITMRAPGEDAERVMHTDKAFRVETFSSDEEYQSNLALFEKRYEKSKKDDAVFVMLPDESEFFEVGQVTVAAYDDHGEFKFQVLEESHKSIIDLLNNGDRETAFREIAKFLGRTFITDTYYPVEYWQKIASPVWMDINPNDTLQYKSAREHDDERHIAPLQLEVIKRGIELWTNPGDIVLDQHSGIASTGYVAVPMGRKYIGIELKGSYFKQGVGNMMSLGVQADLFGSD